MIFHTFLFARGHLFRQAGPSPRTPAAGGAISLRVRGQLGHLPECLRPTKASSEAREWKLTLLPICEWPVDKASSSEQASLLVVFRAKTNAWADRTGCTAAADAPAPNKNARDSPKRLMCGCGCVWRRCQIRCR